jgi:hypothetical protein
MKSRWKGDAQVIASEPQEETSTCEELGIKRQDPCCLELNGLDAPHMQQTLDLPCLRGYNCFDGWRIKMPVSVSNRSPRSMFR